MPPRVVHHSNRGENSQAEGKVSSCIADELWAHAGLEGTMSAVGEFARKISRDPLLFHWFRLLLHPL